MHSRGSMEAAGISTLQLAHCSRETVVPATKVSLDFLQVLALPVNITANGFKTEDRNKSSTFQKCQFQKACIRCARQDLILVVALKVVAILSLNGGRCVSDDDDDDDDDDDGGGEEEKPVRGDDNDCDDDGGGETKKTCMR